MAQNIQSLWSPEIKAIVLSPLTILKGQADALALQTGGVLVVEIDEERQEGTKTISFDVVVPALNGSRHRILKVVQSEGQEYPAFVEAEVFQFEPRSRKRADSDDKFTALVAEVLRSGQVLSVAQSLVARANEVLRTNAPAQ